MAAPRMRRRASTTPDLGRISRAVQRPGIDPRINCVIGWVISDVYVDKDHGPFVDVKLQTGEEETARVGAIYAGPGYGLYTPLGVDDEVLLCAPMGNFNAGLVVVQRLHSASDPPPAGAHANPTDLLLLVKKDAHVRLQVQGGGNLVLIVENGKVLLGAETGTHPVARKDDPVNIGSFNILGGVGNALTGIQHIAPDGTVTAFSVTGAPPPIACSGAVKDGSTKTESA